MTTEDQQEAARKMVGREVHYCVSALISELAKLPQFADDLLPALVADDWESPAIEAGWAYRPHCWSRPKTQEELARFNPPYLGGDRMACADAQTACEIDGLDPYQCEAYEHWIVSDWLADKLEAKGEMIVRDFLGLTIWGRTTSGQAIYIDGVIEEIMADMQRAIA